MDTAPSPPPADTGAQYRRLAVLLGVSDLFCLLAAFGAAYLARFGSEQGPTDYLLLVALASPAFLLAMGGFRLYSVSRLAPAEEFRRIFYAVTLGITGIVTVSYWTKAEVSRLWIGSAWLLALLFLLVARRVWRHRVFRARQKGKLRYRTLIVGANEEAAHLAKVMAFVGSGYEPVGYVRGEDRSTSPMEGLPCAGTLDDLPAAIESLGVECLFAASSDLRELDMAVVTRASRRGSLEVRVSANFPEMMATRLSAQPLGGVMAFSVWPIRLSRAQVVMKRSLDLVVGVTLLAVSLLVWPFIALAIAAGSKGPVLFRQERIGRRGRAFTLLKFRTMIEGEERPHRPESDTDGPLFKSRTDPRITSFGRFLRRWSLDEMPQLLNVLRGDMSLVGPRPPLASEVERYEDWQRDRLEVRPGMTGLWQVSGRSELSFEDYVRLDLFYVENWSLAYDLFLLFKTVPAVITGRGAF